MVSSPTFEQIIPMEMGKHALWMLVGCIVPVLILFLLPALGLSSDIAIAAFFVLMMGCHLMHGAIHKSGQQNSHEPHAHSREDHQ